MKKIAAIIIFFFIASTNSFALVFIDGFGSYVQADDLKNQIGGGAGFGFDLTSDLNFIAKMAITNVTENPDDPDETKYEHMTYLAGVEYVPVIPVLQNYRVKWRTSILLGGSNSEVEAENTDSISDNGIAWAFWTGIQYDLTQVISPFFDLGYHSSYYTNEFEDAKVQGFQIELGLRFHITGSRDYTGDYQ